MSRTATLESTRARTESSNAGKSLLNSYLAIVWPVSIDRSCMQMLRRKIRTQIRAMAPDRAVLHEAIFQKDLLAGLDLLSAKYQFALQVDDALRKKS